jgi:hypothetical protein
MQDRDDKHTKDQQQKEEGEEQSRNKKKNDGIEATRPTRRIEGTQLSLSDRRLLLCCGGRVSRRPTAFLCESTETEVGMHPGKQ